MASPSFLTPPAPLARLRKHPPYCCPPYIPITMTQGSPQRSIATLAASTVFLLQPLLLSFPLTYSQSPSVSESLSIDRSSVVPTITRSPITAAPQVRDNPSTTGVPSSLELHILLRLSVAIACGAIIGVERRAANSTAGLRTFSLVSLGAALFMVTALAAYAQGKSGDPARMAASVATGVGFLGAGSITKQKKQHRGLTTAAGIWIAAALGVSAACGLFLLSFVGAVITAMVARYARLADVIRDDENGVRGDGHEGERRRRERSEREGKEQRKEGYPSWKQTPLDIVLLSTGGAPDAGRGRKRNGEKSKPKDSKDDRR